MEINRQKKAELLQRAVKQHSYAGKSADQACQSLNFSGLSGNIICDDGFRLVQ